MVLPKAPPVLILNKIEWERLKRAAEPPQPPLIEKSDYLQKLNERSREWTKTWPDSIEGVVAKVTKVKEKKRQREREIVTKYKEIERLKTLIDREALEGAKQKIFNNSCYGKQLISALLESKAIEEREAQIEFNKKRKEEALQLAKEEELMNTLQVGLGDEEKILRRKEIDKKLAEEYKAIVEETKRKQKEEREKEILGELEDARLMKQLLDIEPHDLNHCKLRAIEEARSHMEEQKYYRKLKEIRNKEDDALVQVWKEYHERVRCREQKVMDKGVVAKVTKVKEKKRQREREIVTKYKEIERLKTLIDREALEGAKQKIFNNSCYGKQLISALLESKAIEEREAQIEFNKKRKEEALQLAKEEELMNTLQVGLGDEEKILRRKEIDKKLAEEYKAIVEETKRKQKEEREKEILGELEDARLMKQLLDIEPHDLNHCKLRAIEEARSHMEEQKYYRKLKEIRNKEDDALVQVWKEYHERVRCREQKVMDKIHKARNDIPNLKLTYQMLEKLNDEEQKRYDEFVEKGVDTLDNRIIEEDQKEAMKQRKIKEQFLEYAKDNKLQGELLKSYCQGNKCVCEKQTLAINTHPKYGKTIVEVKKEATQSFINPNNVGESKVCEKDLNPCKCNCKKKCEAMKSSFANSSTSIRGTKGSSQMDSLTPLLIKKSNSNKISSMSSSKQTSSSFNSIEATNSYKYMKGIPPTYDFLLVTPSSLQSSSETSSTKCNTEGRHSEEAKKGELVPACDSKSLGIKNVPENKIETKEVSNKQGDGPSFLKPKNKLIEALKQREKEPTPWTGLKGTHEYFANQASGILKECRHKKMAQKVVNEYKKVNRLDTLPISNWN